jgi:hypothetical protein
MVVELDHSHSGNTQTENRVVWRIFGPKRVEVTVRFGLLCNEKLHIVLLAKYCFGDKIKEN